MKEDTNNNVNKNALSQEIIDAAFILQHMITLTRSYERCGKGKKYQFTRGTLLSAKDALAGLQPLALRIVARLAKNQYVARMAVQSHVEQLQEVLDNLLDENLSDECPIFRFYGSEDNLDRAIRELSHGNIVSSVARRAGMLADRVSKRLEERNSLATVEVE
jgi:hypothetical protein